MILQAAIGVIWANPQPEGLDAELFSEHVNPNCLHHKATTFRSSTQKSHLSPKI